MNITITKDYDKRENWYEELEMSFDDSVRLTIRRYPRTTFITYFNEYRGNMKNLVRCLNSSFSLWENLDPVLEKCKLPLSREDRVKVQTLYFSSIRKKGDGYYG